MGIFDPGAITIQATRFSLGSLVVVDKADGPRGVQIVVDKQGAGNRAFYGMVAKQKLVDGTATADDVVYRPWDAITAVAATPDDHQKASRMGRAFYLANRDDFDRR